MYTSLGRKHFGTAQGEALQSVIFLTLVVCGGVQHCSAGRQSCALAELIIGGGIKKSSRVAK